jgi:hypothetical protein
MTNKVIAVEFLSGECDSINDWLENNTDVVLIDIIFQAPFAYIIYQE